MGIPITDACSACGAMLMSFADRFACRTCFDQKMETPTMCFSCLTEHRKEKHPGVEIGHAGPPWMGIR